MNNKIIYEFINDKILTFRNDIVRFNPLTPDHVNAPNPTLRVSRSGRIQSRTNRPSKRLPSKRRHPCDFHNPSNRRNEDPRYAFPFLIENLVLVDPVMQQ